MEEPSRNKSLEDKIYQKVFGYIFSETTNSFSFLPTFDGDRWGVLTATLHLREVYHYVKLLQLL